MILTDAEKQKLMEMAIEEGEFYDEEEIHPDCTVQVLRNSKTGKVSVGWWKNIKEMLM